MQSISNNQTDLARLRCDLLRLPAPAHRARWVAHRTEMRVHTRGEHPGPTLLRRHQTEDEACHRWRLDNFVPITQPAMQRALAQLSRLFEPGSWALEASPDLEALLRRPQFAGLDFSGFVQQLLLPRLIEDPNAWLVWLPTGAGLTDPSQPVDVRPVLVDCDRIHYLDDEVLIYLAEEKSWVDLGNGPVREGQIYVWLTSDAVARSVQYGRAYERNFRFEVVYRHGLGERCGFPLGGVAREVGYYESFFARFLPFAHEALRQFSDWQVVTAANAYPIKELRVMPCDAPGCYNGQVNGQTCTRCEGRGYAVRTGPFAALVRPQSNSALGEAESDAPMLRYITPPTEILRYAQQAWESLLERAEDAISLRQPREPQSGIAKAYDREELYALLEQIGRHVLEGLIERSLWMLERLIAPFRPVRPRVLRRGSFRPDDRESLRRLWQERASQGPARGLVWPALLAWADSQYPPHSTERRLAQLVVQLDPLSPYTLAEQQQLLAQGVVRAEEVRFSVQLPHALQALLEERGSAWFLAADVAAVRSALAAQREPMQANRLQTVSE